MNPKPPLSKILAIMVVVVVMIPLSLSSEAHAAERVALLIANEDYNRDDLKNPINDAKLIQQTLHKLDYDVTVVKNANRYKMLNAIDKFGKESKGADSAIFYYAGHGMQDDYKQNFLLPVDASISNESSIRAYGVEAYEVINALKKAKPRISLVIFDACRENPFAKIRGNRNFSVESYQTDSELLVSYATQTGKYAEDGNGRNSPYAIALEKQLAQADSVPLLEMFDNVKNDVRQQTNNKQSPTRMGDVEVGTYLVTKKFNDINIFFSRDKTVIQDKYKSNLKKIAHAMDMNPYQGILINGHTENIGPSQKYQQRISEARAVAVKSFLVNELGISPMRIVTQGFGAQRPIYSNSGSKSHLNNRAEIFFNTGKR